MGLLNIFEKRDLLVEVNKEIEQILDNEATWKMGTKSGRLKFLYEKRRNIEHELDRFERKSV